MSDTGQLRHSCSSYTEYEPLPNNPKVSVILTLYTESQLNYLQNILPALQTQTYDNIEVVVLPETDPVITQTTDMIDRLSDDRFVVEPLAEVSGLSEARNNGAEVATGDIVAFLDIDAIPADVWVENLVTPYVQLDLFAVGGRATPGWEQRGSRPATVPPAFDWLVGSNHDEFADAGDLVRNTYGCNISFRRDVFLELGGYDDSLGKSHGHNLQGEEPHLGFALKQHYQTGVYYAPDATITHFVSPEQQTLSWLSNRAYLQGISKAVIQSLHEDDALGEEDDYLSFILFSAIPSYLWTGFTNLSPKYIGFAVLCLWYTFLVGIGFLKGKRMN